MVGGIVALNQVQKVPSTSISGTVTDSGTVQKNFYTVPAGRKALITSIKLTEVAFGTGTFTETKIANLLFTHIAVAATLLTERLATPFVLLAGQSISYLGDAAGNNGTINYVITYQETPA